MPEEVEVQEWTPQHERQHPPFEPGNMARLTHGAWSRRIVDPLVADLVERTLSDPATAYLAAPRYEAAVRSWARAETRVALLDRWLTDRADSGVDDEGQVLPVLTALRLWDVRASNARSKLGLDPVSAARMGRDVVASQVDMARLLSGLSPVDSAPVDEVEVGEDDASE